MGNNGVAEKLQELQRTSARRDLARHTAHRPPVVAIVPVRRVQFTGIVVQVVGVVTTKDRRRPIVAVRAEIVQRRTIDVARPSEYTLNKRKIRAAKLL